MKPRVDNYQYQAAQAKKLFLTYDQQELIRRCRLNYDDNFFYIRFLGEDYRICRQTGNMERRQRHTWVDGNSFNEVMILLDWLCDSKADRFITGTWVNVVSQGHYFHGNLQEEKKDPYALRFDRDPAGFSAACKALGGEAVAGADISFAIELVDGLKILVQLWHGDEEFAPRLRYLWDANALMYLRYETTWYAVGLLLARLREKMEEQGCLFKQNDCK